MCFGRFSQVSNYLEGRPISSNPEECFHNESRPIFGMAVTTGSLGSYPRHWRITLQWHCKQAPQWVSKIFTRTNGRFMDFLIHFLDDCQLIPFKTLATTPVR